MTSSADLIEASERRSAHNYHPLPVVIHEAHGAWVTDVEGRRYLDFLSGYSSLNFGHGNEKIIEAAQEQLKNLTLTSRAFYHDQFARFCAGLGDLTGKDMILPMNTGAEAVETAIKVARKWGYQVKGVEPEQADIIVMEDNFHGRTTTIVSFSTDPDARGDFGPYTPGFTVVKYGSAEAIRSAIGPNTVAVLVEPIQGEAGVLVPPDGYLAQVREICTENNVLMIADEIQSGLGRTGRTFACDHEGVVPDIYVLGKALGGGVVPVSAIAANEDVLGVIKPGQHGSTFGGNPLACAVGNAVIDLLNTGEFQERAARLGDIMHARLRELVGDGVVTVRGRGLWAGVDVDPSLATGREVSKALLERGVLAKDTHGSTIRLAPPIVISEEDLHRAVDLLADALASFR
ncbi:ornithine--oxo-acid transaminase [Nonomuraea ceibae]|uniref:ornithine--oxo-acid transaminase n=1 Tax=Nonomuraea ceibae TaxID=1935170 RepID=UPI001C6073D5|nr:ornithine--oxo-acid transaminase [Nonomuraea ceibae]